MKTEQIRAKLQEIFATEDEYDFAMEEIVTFYQRSGEPTVDEIDRIRKLNDKVWDYNQLLYIEMKDGGSHRKNARISREASRSGIRGRCLGPWMGHYPYNLYSVHYEDEGKAREIGMSRIRKAR